MAKFSDSIPLSTTIIPSPDKCDCNYHKDECIISWPVSSGKACKCNYKELWSCSGSIVFCDSSRPKCVNLDESQEACQLSKGDCGGYLINYYQNILFDQKKVK